MTTSRIRRTRRTHRDQQDTRVTLIHVNALLAAWDDYEADRQRSFAQRRGVKPPHVARPALEELRRSLEESLAHSEPRRTP